MACTNSIIQACDMPQFLVDQTPKFDEIIMEDIRPVDGWLLNVSTGTVPMGTPVEITQDRFRSVFANTTKVWQKVQANGPGCSGAPCDPPEHQIGWGADRLTYYAEQQTWSTPLICYDQDMHITHAEQHIAQIINDILRPNTTNISSNFLRKRHLLWSKQKWQANATMDSFTFQWTLSGPNTDEESYFDCSVNPNNVFLLVPQMLQNRWTYLMLRGYAGKNPFQETLPFIELVTDMDTLWSLEHLGGQVGMGGGQNPSVTGNWRFESWDSSTKYWRFGFSGTIGNYACRVDPMGMRFNYVADLGANANGGNGNRYRYQIVLPFRNGITTGAGGAAGLGSDVNPDYQKAQYAISQIHHKKGMELLTSDSGSLSSEMPFAHRDFGGKWMFQMHDLGADQNGLAIKNAWQNKGRFAAWFKYYVRPLHYEFMEAIFHMREQFCVPTISPCAPSPGYPAQEYNSALPTCPLPGTWPTNAGPIEPTTSNAIIQGVTEVIAGAPSLPTDTFQTTSGDETATNPPDQ
jgi:hypothetical protein